MEVIVILILIGLTVTIMIVSASPWFSPVRSTVNGAFVRSLSALTTLSAFTSAVKDSITLVSSK